MFHKKYFPTLALAVALAGCTTTEIPYNPDVELNVGDAIILKGIRTRCDGTTAPTFANVQGDLPQSRLGTFSDGGAGVVQSVSCGKAVPGRAVKFTATAPGRENLTVYGDRFSVVVTN